MGGGQKRGVLVTKPVEYYPKFSARGQFHYFFKQKNSAKGTSTFFGTFFNVIFYAFPNVIADLKLFCKDCLPHFFLAQVKVGSIVVSSKLKTTYVYEW